jgi:hypothetical protein
VESVAVKVPLGEVPVVVNWDLPLHITPTVPLIHLNLQSTLIRRTSGHNL